VITFSVSGISWTGHVGGMIVGAVIGFLLPPTQIATLGGMWRTPSGERLERPMAGAVRLGVYLGVLVLLVVGSYIAVRFVG
jgi:hypothetical protein